MSQKLFVLLGGPYNGQAVQIAEELQLEFMHMVEPVMNDDNLIDSDFGPLGVSDPRVDVYRRQTRYTMPGQVPYTVYIWEHPANSSG